MPRLTDLWEREGNGGQIGNVLKLVGSKPELCESRELRETLAKMMDEEFVYLRRSRAPGSR